MSEPLIVAIVVGVVGPLLTLAVTRLWDHSRQRADVAGMAADKWRAWAEKLEYRLEACENRIKTLEQELAYEQQANSALEEQVKEQQEQVKAQASLLKLLAGWARQMEKLLGPQAPAAPPDVEEALTTLDPSS